MVPSLILPTQPIRVQVEVYVPKNNSSWFVTMPFTSDDIIEIAGTLTALQNTLTICLFGREDATLVDNQPQLAVQATVQ